MASSRSGRVLSDRLRGLSPHQDLQEEESGYEAFYVILGVTEVGTQMRGALPDEDSVIVLMGKTAMDKESYSWVIPRIKADRLSFPTKRLKKRRLSNPLMGRSPCRTGKLM